MSLRMRGPIGLLSGVCLAFAALVPNAVAQDAQDTSGQPEAPIPPTASDEIVVTATGRSAALQDVPIAITALNAEAVANAGIQDLRQIEQIAPSFRTFTGQSNAASTTLFIRGIGTGGDNPGFEPAVGVFLDGVFRNRSSVAISELPEVERIEVLRGPQGTLFGRNTSAGALSVTTASPEFDYRVFGGVQVGNFDYISTTAGLTGPIIEDTLAFRLEGNWQNRDGYINNLTPGERDINDRNRYFIRGQLLWDISPDASFRLIADISETNEVCCGAIVARPGSTAAAVNAVAGLRGLQGILPVNLNARNAVTTPGRNYNEAIDEWGVSGQLDWSIGDINLVSITSYREWVARRDQDIDFNDTDRAFRDDYIVGYDTFSQELRLQGEAGRLDWLVGGFFYQEDARVTDTTRFGADAALFLDALAAGVPLPIDLDGPGPAPATPITGFNIFGSLGTTGCGPVAAVIANCRLLGALFNSAVGAPTANAYASAVAAGVPGVGQGQFSDNFTTDTTAFAFFTHDEIELTDALTLTLGGRYNRENKKLEADLTAIAPACGALQGPFAALTQQFFTNPQLIPLAAFPTLICNPVVNTVANGQYSDERTENEFTGTASLAWKVTDDILVYGGYSRGYKSGGYNLDRSGFAITPFSTTAPSANELEFDSEFVNAYEIGSKITLPFWETTLNSALYLQRVRDYQLNAFTGFNFQTFNVPSVDSRGFELDLTSRPLEFLSFQGGLAYNVAELDSTIQIAQDTFGPGTPLPFAPRWTLTGSANYKRPIGYGLYGQVYADVRWSSEYSVRTTGRFAPGSVPGARSALAVGDDITDNDAFALVNARISVGDEDGRWAFDFFVRNLTDKFYNVGGFDAPEQDTVVVYPSQPRTWSAQLRFNF